jgi:hypothetical protein
MARVRIKVRPGAGVRGYSLFVDGMPLTLGPEHRGEALCEGRCGDGSRHSLLYTYIGRPGATLSVRLWCGGREVLRLFDDLIAERGSARRAGRMMFRI